MSTKITRTVYGSELQAAQFPGVPWSLRALTTLNEKFNILSGQTPSAGVTPQAKYFCIGNGGHTAATGTNGVVLNQAVPHTSVDAALYSHLPFILRAINNDITADVQVKYALRQQITVSGQQYYAYWLKRLDLSGAIVSTAISTLANGQTTSTANFVPSSGNLNPTPPVVNSAGANTLSNQIATSAMNVPLSFTQQECVELLNAATILYGDPAYAIISEIGICSGTDTIIPLSNGGTFAEAIAVQIATFINTMHIVQYTANGFSGSYNLGTAEPLLVLNAS